MTSHEILGRQVQIPVEIRQASAFMAMYSVPTRAAQSLIGYSGLEVLQYRPGHGICALVFVDYVDGDLGPYNEFGVAFMVRDHRVRGGSVARTSRPWRRAGRAPSFTSYRSTGSSPWPPAAASGGSPRCSPTSTPTTPARSSAPRSVRKAG